ncbi:MAG TPA: serine/threonine-protein kinase, partial [Pyrinomonadaceae bacterium]|nr:serine/threonine-protein kinase [Pyrinomonadaceae bacterium]
KGEELSSLLRRIGRLPSDKALQIARQICAGLAAAHDSGVLHRDLKPSNVMIDADGNARLTDFGIAGLAEEIRDDEVSAGTPAYMAPEQLDGKPPTIRSDIYSLGLVLYELFTGKRAFDASTLDELLKLRRSDSAPTTPTSLVKDLEPVIESIIDRCMQKDPARRPASALQVAAALPGGDPIAAALAAGETPSPEMVAAAPKAGALKPAVAISALAGTVAVLLFLLLASRSTRAERNVSLDKPPEVLAERARDIIANLGYQNSPVDQAHGFFFDQSFPRYLQTQDFKGWEVMRSGQPLTFYYWYKQAPRYLIADGSVVILPWNPPPDIAGMTNITLDPRGRLVRFERVPPQIEESAAPSANTDWSRLFAAAGLDQTKFTPTQPKWVPLLYADERAAWEGPHVDHPQFPVRIEAAAFASRPVNFEIIFPWDRPFRQEEQSITGGERVATIMLFTIFLGVAIGAALLGRRNLQLGRGDKRSAFRVAIFIFMVSVIGGVLGAHHVPDLGEELSLITLIVAFSLAPAALIWLLYIALEPHVRRRWPRLIISWSRLMAGNYRDPMVGRDLLIGGLFGLIHGSCIPLGLLVTRWFGFEAPPIITINVLTLASPRRLLAVFLSSHVVSSVFVGFAFLFFLLLLYIILRKEWLAALALFLIALGIEVSAFAFGGPRLFWVGSILIAATLTILISRFGLLATIVAQLFFFLSIAYPLTTDFSAWYAPSTIFALVIALGVAIYGFYISLGGRIGWMRFTEVS